jgi:hypothetical protein
MLQRRTIRQQGARLALLALFVQLALTFGHIHPWDIYRYGHPVAQGVGAAEVLPDRGTMPIPLTPLADDAAADLACSICATMALARATVLPDPIRLPTPSASGAQSTRLGKPFSPAPIPFLLFQTRAPPIV